MTKNNIKNNRIVYSTQFGRMCPDCGKPADNCICRVKNQKVDHGDGIVRIRRETKGRRGKTVTTISGVPLNPGDLLDLTAQIKKTCGTGGSVKYNTIIIQGDFRDRIVQLLEKQGYKVKLAGG